MLILIMRAVLPQRTPSYIRLFLQYKLGDLVLSAVTLITLAFTSSRSSRWHESTCNELFTQPDLLRLLLRFGVNIQECEIWLEKFITTAITVLCIVLILKVCFPNARHVEYFISRGLTLGTGSIHHSGVYILRHSLTQIRASCLSRLIRSHDAYTQDVHVPAKS